MPGRCCCAGVRTGRESLAGAEDKLAQLDAEQTRRGTAIDLGMPTFTQIAIRTSDVEEPAP